MSNKGESHDVGGSGAVAVPNRGRPPKRKVRSGAGRPPPGRRPTAIGGGDRGGRRSPFEYYKKGQGTWTRGGTAVGGGVLIALGCHFLFGQLESAFDTNEPWTLYVKAGVPVLVGVVLGMVLWWIVGVSRTTSDFMIATEGEMKKVSWSSKKELIGSTKVVILFTVLLALALFVVDFGFMHFFRWIGVLKLAS